MSFRDMYQSTYRWRDKTVISALSKEGVLGKTFILLKLGNEYIVISFFLLWTGLKFSKSLKYIEIDR